jgi:hypothetical protein
MCDYSLHSVASRPARVSDKLVTKKLARSTTRAFAAVGEYGAKLVIHDGPPEVAVCLLPGTELAFDENVRYDRAFRLLGKGHLKHKVARFRQIDIDDPHVQHDALEFPDGKVLKVARLATGQTATVLQLPVATQHPEPAHTGHLARSSDSRVSLNRLPLKPGMASILVPNQGAVMLWQAFRSTATSFSTALTQSIRRLTAHRQHPILRATLPAGLDAETIEAKLKKDVLTAPLPKKSAAQQKNIDLKTAA